MAKARLRLDAEIDLLNKDELDHSLTKAGKWQYEAAYATRPQEIPRMIGTPAAGTLNLGGDQPEQVWCGPKASWSWSLMRLSVDGLASGDAVKVYKDTRFIGWVSYQPGFIAFGKGQCVLKAGDFLRITGTGLTATGQIEVYGDAIQAPSVMVWSIIR